MNITYERSNVVNNSSLLNINKDRSNIIIMGKAETARNNCEIFKPRSVEDARKIYGNSDLSDAYELAHDLNTENIYTVNCYNLTDYIETLDKLVHYNFTYIVPINLFLSDMFYDPVKKENRYFANFFIEMLNDTESLSTVIFTERHASLFDDIDHFVFTMKSTLAEYKYNTNTNLKTPNILQDYGNDLIFVLNNLEKVEHSNVALASMLANRYPSNYPEEINITPVFDINKRDVKEYDMAYFKTNYITKETSIDNLINLRSDVDIYKNVVIDDVIKTIIKTLDFNSFKGKLYNLYTKIQLDNQVKTTMDNLKGKLFKDYEIINIGFTNMTATSGYVYVELSITPYGSFEAVNIVMGV